MIVMIGAIFAFFPFDRMQNVAMILTSSCVAHKIVFWYGKFAFNLHDSEFDFFVFGSIAYFSRGFFL